LNRTRTEWVDATINLSITGCRNFGRPEICGDYCYARRMALRLGGRSGYPEDDPFRPTFHRNKVAEITWKRDRPSRIFLNSMADWFSEGVEPEWIQEVLRAVGQNVQDTFFVLTKRPENLGTLKSFRPLPGNLWWGVSVTTQQDAWRIQELVKMLPEAHKFVSFEPLHGPISAELEGIEWIIIGAESGNRLGRIAPNAAWILDLLAAAAGECIPAFMKDNLKPHIPADWDLVQQYPEARQ